MEARAAAAAPLEAGKALRAIADVTSHCPRGSWFSQAKRAQLYRTRQGLRSVKGPWPASASVPGHAGLHQAPGKRARHSKTSARTEGTLGRSCLLLPRSQQRSAVPSQNMWLTQTPHQPRGGLCPPGVLDQAGPHSLAEHRVFNGHSRILKGCHPAGATPRKGSATTATNTESSARQTNGPLCALQAARGEQPSSHP